MEDNKKSKSLVIKVVVVVLLLLIIVGLVIVLLLPKKNNKNNDNNLYNKNNVSTTTKAKNTDFSKIDESFLKPERESKRNNSIKFIDSFAYETDSYTSENKVTLLLKNVSEEIIDVDVYLNFYKDGLRIKSSYSGYAYNVKPSSNFVIEFSRKIDEEFDDFDFSYRISKSKSNHINVDVDKSKIIIEKDQGSYSDTVIFKYLNDTANEMTYSVCMIYKKDGKIVFADDGYDFEVKPSETAEIKFYKVSRPKDLEYDDYEFDVFSSYYKVEDV